ncbi:MAG TPA: hypothetical protein VFQ26_09130 [Nitrospiraceae bacterium]|nr:hypothetical protein [Nitrospiraceae bacterium]
MVVNEGKIDQLLQLNDILTERIKDLTRDKINMGEDPVVDLLDIEDTHLTFMVARYKPIVKLAFEYIIVQPSAGTPQFDSQINFEIPQAGDFIHDMLLNVHVGPIRTSVLSTPIQKTGTPTSPAQFPFNGENADGTAAANTFYEIVDVNGTVLVEGVAAPGPANAPVQYRNFVSWVENPGNALIKHVKFAVNSNDLDQYGTDVINMHQKFMVGKDKKPGYDRLTGQESARMGFRELTCDLVTDTSVHPVNDVDVSTGSALYAIGTVTPSVLNDGITGPNQVAQRFSSTTPVYNVSREQIMITDGPQTPKPELPPMSLGHKLLLFSCDSGAPSLSIPSVSIPNGQRTVTVSLHSLERCVQQHTPIYLRTIVDTGTARTITYKPIYQHANILGDRSITKASLYVNNIYYNVDLHDIFLAKTYFNLVRVWKSQRFSYKNDNQEFLLSQFKFPVEWMMIAAQPHRNVVPPRFDYNGTLVEGNHNYWYTWNKYCNVLDSTKNSGLVVQAATGAAASTPTFSNSPIQNTRYFIDSPIIRSLSVKSSGNEIVKNIHSSFFSDYVPISLEGPKLFASQDPNVFFHSFALFPTLYQPSGYFNLSRARETYIYAEFKPNGLSSPFNNGELIVVSRPINFLIVSDGTAVLRYTA